VHRVCLSYIVRLSCPYPVGVRRAHASCYPSQLGLLRAPMPRDAGCIRGASRLSGGNREWRSGPAQSECVHSRRSAARRWTSPARLGVNGRGGTGPDRLAGVSVTIERQIDDRVPVVTAGFQLALAGLADIENGKFADSRRKKPSLRSAVQWRSPDRSCSQARMFLSAWTHSRTAVSSFR